MAGLATTLGSGAMTNTIRDACTGDRIHPNDLGFARIADEYGMTVDEVKKYFRKREELLPFMNEMLNEKILKLLREHAVITPVPAALVDTPSETESGAAA